MNDVSLRDERKVVLTLVNSGVDKESIICKHLRREENKNEVKTKSNLDNPKHGQSKKIASYVRPGKHTSCDNQ